MRMCYNHIIPNGVHNHELERELWLRDLSRSQGLIYSSVQSFNL